MKNLLLFASFCTFTFGVSAQVGIGTTTPDPSSQLDISATDKGILIPRVSLTDVSNTMIDGVNTAATGLLIYNTNPATTGGSGVGYYYFNSSTWERLSTSGPGSTDVDWYEVGTTTAPDDINDDMFTQGNVAIGKITATSRLDIEEVNAGNGINVLMSGNNATDANGVVAGISDVGTGNHTAFLSQLTGTGNGVHFGLRNELTGSGHGNKYALFNDVSSGGSGVHYSNYSQITGNGSGVHYGTSNLLGGTGGGSQYGLATFISNSGDGSHHGLWNSLSGNGIGVRYGTLNTISGTGMGEKYGTYTRILGTNNALNIGAYHLLETNGNGDHIGIRTRLDGAGSGIHSGVHNEFTGNGTGLHQGVFNNINSSGSGQHIGIRNMLGGSGSNTHIGVSNTISNISDGLHQGVVNNLTGLGNGPRYGTSNNLFGIGTGDKYGTYNFIDPGAGGTHYGVYSQALSAGAFAAYFLGTVSIGTTSLNNYLLPTMRGTANQVIQTDGAGNSSWVDPSSLNITNAFNGLTLSGNNITLGGSLSQNTVITAEQFSLDVNLPNATAGSFSVSDDGVEHFTVNHTGLSFFGGDTYWRDESTVGTNIAIISDDGDDGRFRLMENGVVAIDLDANTQSVFNEQGLDRNFRIEGDGNQNMFFVDAGNDRIGVGVNAPSTTMHVEHIFNTTDGLSISNVADNDRWHFYMFSSNNLYMYFNGAARGNFDDVSGNYTAVSDRNLKSNISEISPVLDKVKALKVVDYNFKHQTDTKRYLGFIAQDVDQFFPQLVKKPSSANGEVSPYMLDYSGFGTIAIKAIQEQQRLIEEQQSEIDTLKQELATIKSMLAQKK